MEFIKQLKYSFKVNAHNIPAHLDVETDIKNQQNGVFTFTLRVNQGCIMDYVNYTNSGATASEYSAIFAASEPECEISLNDRVDGPEDEVRGSNVHRFDQ
jgi:hypothetical protein